MITSLLSCTRSTTYVSSNLPPPPLQGALLQYYYIVFQITFSKVTVSSSSLLLWYVVLLLSIFSPQSCISLMDEQVIIFSCMKWSTVFEVGSPHRVSQCTQNYFVNLIMKTRSKGDRLERSCFHKDLVTYFWFLIRMTKSWTVYLVSKAWPKKKGKIHERVEAAKWGCQTPQGERERGRTQQHQQPHPRESQL